MGNNDVKYIIVNINNETENAKEKLIFLESED